MKTKAKLGENTGSDEKIRPVCVRVGKDGYSHSIIESSDLKKIGM
ncbi:hypothetical protein ACUXEY_000598 [Bacillus sp. F9_6S_D1_P_5]